MRLTAPTLSQTLRRDVFDEIGLKWMGREQALMQVWLLDLEVLLHENVV